jgi:hypothetical protein
MHKWLLLVLLVPLAGFSNGRDKQQSLSQRDIDVLVVVLRNFAQRSETRPEKATEYIAVEPNTWQLDATVTAEMIVASLHGSRDVVSRDAVDDFVRRNQFRYFTRAVAVAGAPMRIESFDQAGGFPLGMRNPNVAAVVTVGAPGFTKGGNDAFVQLRIIRSIHSTYATYVLRRDKVRWTIIASEFFYTV